MTPQLNTLTITDFRSIRGSITIPFNASVVLLHGPNGAGKTSVLSALELALTGEIPAMRRTDPDYKKYLTNRAASFGKIVLTETGVSSAEERPHELVLSNGAITGTPALTGDAGRFFSERCYLAQATLGRLLEIYQDAKNQPDSPLTRFVKDLLGLDTLEALIEGLHATSDVRNLRRLVPEYGDAERTRDAAEVIITQSRRNLDRLAEEASGLRTRIRARLGNFLVAVPESPSIDISPVAEEVFLSDEDERELVAIAGPRRDLANLRQRSLDLPSTGISHEVSAVEGNEATARETAQKWREAAGKSLEGLINDLRSTFPDLPSVASTDPETALRAALARLDADSERCAKAIATDDSLVAQIEAADQAISQNRARIALVDEQISEIAGNTEDLGRVLTALLPHIHDDLCPVCDRHFREVSNDPLVQHLSSRVASLTALAGRLESLTLARLQSTSDLANSERQRESAISQKLTQDGRMSLKSRIGTLSDQRRRLIELAPHAQLGTAAIRHEAEARRSLFELRSRDLVSQELRSGIARVCEELKQPTIDTSESIEVAIHRLDVIVSGADAKLNERQKSRREGINEVRRFRELNAQIQSARQTIEQTSRSKSVQETAIEEADRRRQVAKAIARAAAEASTVIVSRVFNDALNKIWRDLFVRLAPTEPFVPAFCIPRIVGEPVIAQLETVHRDGGRGGTPGAMLSAGNLNTAALTLFTALHLAVKQPLPWLILDDPVQSMDEVHIAQFAALLRTLSREHGRRIILAVHERQLFEYLALELSPAFEGDQLITVEIGRSATGTTLAEPNYRNWEPDAAVAA